MGIYLPVYISACIQFYWSGKDDIPEILKHKITKGKAENMNNPVTIKDVGKGIKYFILSYPKRPKSKTISFNRSGLPLNN